MSRKKCRFHYYSYLDHIFQSEKDYNLMCRPTVPALSKLNYYPSSLQDKWNKWSEVDDPYRTMNSYKKYLGMKSSLGFVTNNAVTFY